MNLLTLLLLFGNLPTHLLFIFIYFTTTGEEGEISYKKLFLIARFINILLRCVHCVLSLVLYKDLVH